MRLNHLKGIFKTAATVLLAGAGAAMAQAPQQVNLTAGPAIATLPGGIGVPMWGYSCGATVSGSTATCAAANPGANGAWSPVIITVPTGQSLQINLTNSLSFPATSGPNNNIPTSLVIVGQLGAGLGTSATSVDSPDHTGAQGSTTWPIAGGAGATAPKQGQRVQSFSTQVEANSTTSLTWTTPKPGTYLLESGTHPSIQAAMGLIGMVVVTAPGANALSGFTAYPGVSYNADAKFIFSEIDPAQNAAVDAAVHTAGFSETMVWSGLAPNGCGFSSSPDYHKCYPPTVNYKPLFYLINGVAFDKTNANGSLFPTTPATVVASTAKVLVRLVNAGLRMHVPSIVGSVTGATPAPGGFSLIAEDGNPLPGLPRVQSEVFMAAGKTYDVMINNPGSSAPALPIFDRELSLSANGTGRDAGMLAYISVNGGQIPAAPSLGSAIANPDTYSAVACTAAPCLPLTVSDAAKGLIANDTNVFAVALQNQSTSGTAVVNADGTFTFTPNAGWSGTATFTYCGNGATTGAACNTVTLNSIAQEASGGITLPGNTFTSNMATYIKVANPGVLAGAVDSQKFPLKAIYSAGSASDGLTILSVDAAGGFAATATGPGTYKFQVQAQNTEGTLSAAATVTVIFPTKNGPTVSVVDGKDKSTTIGDYRWIIEEDRTFFVDPTKTVNSGSGIVPIFGTNFHTSYMPVVATGCTGPISCESGQTSSGSAVVCDQGNGVCRPDTVGNGATAVDPSEVHLDPNRRYYISVLPGDAANAFENGTVAACASATDSKCGHGMGGAPIAAGQTSVTVYTQPNPYPPSKLSVFVFEDDFPLNGEQDGGGGVDVLSPNEPGLGGFNITIMDDAGGPGDPTGQVDYDMFNQPLSNSLSGVKDPTTGYDACPISTQASNDPLQKGITGQIVTCPKYESDGITLSPLAGQAVVANMMPGRYGIIATPAADRIARGEEWLQTNTLDGQKAHDSFLRIGEPSFFQEYGPAGYHVSIGFANPKIINDRKKGVCDGSDVTITGTNCSNIITGRITTERMSRTPDERLYSSGSNDSFAFTQCYISFGDPDGEDFAFTKCASDGTFTLSGLPDGDWRITVFDQWNDMLVDGLSTPVRLNSTNNSGCGNGSSGSTCNLGDLATNQWQSNIYTSTFFDKNGNGVRDPDEEGLALVPTNIRFRDGSFSNFNNTDLEGNAGFNEVFPLFSWYLIETDQSRYKNTGTHVVYDAGGPADGTPCGNAVTPPGAPCGKSKIANFMANTAEVVSLPTDLRFPGSVYCADADCSTHPNGIKDGPASSDPPSKCSTDTNGNTQCSVQLSTGRIDPGWVMSEGWQGFSGQNSFLEFGKTPYAAGENGGIRGHVVYASTRPFDDPQLLLQLSWEPLIPNVTINLYQEGTAPDGSASLALVDTTKTSSFDDWAQGFRSDNNPNMNCPGQGASTGSAIPDLFFFSLFNQPEYLDTYNATYNGTTAHTMPYNSQFKCYDGMHNWNQLQPAPYDGMYQFPSIAGRNSVSGAPVGGTGSVAGTNCSICVANPTDGTPMLPAGKYVVEVVVPPGYELVKEEDKNILIGDNFIAPVTVQFPGLGGSIYILPDQATIADATNPNNGQNSTTDLGRTTFPTTEADTGQLEQYWRCVGTPRMVPDFISLFPGSSEVAPFAGATRNLCDRKEVNLADQAAVQARFYLFTSTHAAAHFTGVITDDYTSEFDPFSPQFGEKFSPPDLPVAIKDWTGLEIQRVYADHWGSYNGLTYSTWEVNPPNPTGYSPTMMITCMNDPGTAVQPDALFNPQYSQFCYEIPFMPGQTQYMDTPVVPTSAFAGAGYNNPDCSYPDATPAISEVNGDGVGPWVAQAGNTLTITALGDQMVNNNAYSGPSATGAPYNQKKVQRHYGFGTNQGSGTVTIGGINATVTSWSDNQIQVTVPTGIAACPRQQQQQYGGPASTDPQVLCGQLVITADNGMQSIDSVTVTVGGKTPTVLTAGQTIQDAINKAAPGDLIIVPKGQYQEMVLMWKPVRLQGVGAASSIINANTHPAGKVETWRRNVNCLFGLALNGTPIDNSVDPKTNQARNPYDSTGAYTCGAGLNFFTPTANNPQIDRLPLEATVGWDATLNGNLAELLQEPTLMGALEGAAITVLSKGVRFTSNPFAADTFPTGTQLFTDRNSQCGSNSPTARNPFPSNFLCNPSRIDGLGITDSSQGGGGIFVHAWGHYLEISNNRVYNNAGTLSGGINVGQGEFPPAYLGGSANTALNAAPGSCETSNQNGVVLPYCHDIHVNVHNNAVVGNSSTGDELFSATPAGAGGVSFCTGSDYYNFNYNWVCGNLSTGDGGGFGHLGFTKDGSIQHNTFLFNQATNPTIPTNGGAMVIMGAPDVDPPCSVNNDADCVSVPGQIGPSDGSGPGLVINANLIMGNAAESGSGGGIRLQNVNGTDVVTFPTRSDNWNTVSVTNNIITNNVAGWDGAGISLVDALKTDIINNTIAANDTTASAGVLFNTLGAPLASSNGPCGVDPTTGMPAKNPCVTESTPQPAGLVSIQNSAVLVANLPNRVNCPSGYFSSNSGTNGNCRQFSVPKLMNNVFWQNRAYRIGVGSLGNGGVNQQNVVALLVGNTTNPAPPQPQNAASVANGAGTRITGGTGACVEGVSYWDLGVRGDTGPTDHSGGQLTPSYSVITDAADYATFNGNSLHNSGGDPTFLSQYCNGSRVPPELGSMGYQVPPGISDASVPNPLFSLTPAATVDEGNNWINISWGPLALSTPTGTTLGNYGPASTSSVIGLIPSTASANFNAAPTLDFFGNERKTNNAVDAGAVEYKAPNIAILSVAPTSLTFNGVAQTTTSAVQTLTLTNSGGAAATNIAVAVTTPFARSGGNCGTTLSAQTSCTIGIVFSPTLSTSTTAATTGTATITASVAVTGSPVQLSGTATAAVIRATLRPTSWTVSQTRNCPGSTIQQRFGCAFDPVTTFTLTNTGNVPLTGVTAGSLSGTAANAANYAIVGLLSTCGNTTHQTLQPNSTCTVTVQFKPLTSQVTGLKSATVSVSDLAGTQSATLNGTAR